MLMRFSVWLLLVLLQIFSALFLSLAQDQSGFISLSCGLARGDSFTENATNIIYISDANFINTGDSRSIKQVYQTDYPQQTWYLRSFPQGKRNCYTLNLTAGDKYLIRASFLHGGYDDNASTQFDLHLGPNLWSTISTTNDTDESVVEMVHLLTSNRLQICLVKTGDSNPFISSLELRKLINTTYVAQQGSLQLVKREDVGATGSQGYRHGKDVNDRFWTPYTQDDWSNISTNQSVSVNDTYEPPELAMATASVPTDPDAHMNISLNGEDKTVKFFVVMQFAEIQELKSNETREFNIKYNNKHIHGPLTPGLFATTFIYTNLDILADANGEYLFSLQRTENSTLPPLLNALEVYKIILLPLQETDGKQVDAMMNIKSSYGVNKIDWQGDPCVPQNYNIVLNDLCENSSFERNIGLCSSASCPTTKKKKKNTVIAPVAVSLVSFFLIAAGIVTFLILKKKKRAKLGLNPDSKSHNGFGSPVIAKNRKLNYMDVVKITNNFERVLGKGGFGTVYYGILDNETVAVKMLTESTALGYKQFKAEVELLLRVHHKNLTCLVGYCEEGDKMSLIYEFMANGDLKEHLSGKRGPMILTWERRLRIAAESAQGLEYLHNGCKPQIVHRDIKTTNILLDGKFQAKLADFGLSRSFPLGSESHISTVVAGTPGYFDPEYYMTNRLTEKSDVFSFGVVLLELVTNRPVIDHKREEPYIGEWVGLMLSRGDINSIVDPKLQGDFDPNTIWKVVETAMTCLNPSSSRRPTMSQVVLDLKECLNMEMARNMGSHVKDSTNDSSIDLSIDFTTELNPGAR